jgi:hypothetical protein
VHGSHDALQSQGFVGVWFEHLTCRVWAGEAGVLAVVAAGVADGGGFARKLFRCARDVVGGDGSGARGAGVDADRRPGDCRITRWRCVRAGRGGVVCGWRAAGSAIPPWATARGSNTATPRCRTINHDCSGAGLRDTAAPASEGVADHGRAIKRLPERRCYGHRTGPNGERTVLRTGIGHTGFGRLGGSRARVRGRVGRRPVRRSGGHAGVPEEWFGVSDTWLWCSRRRWGGSAGPGLGGMSGMDG